MLHCMIKWIQVVIKVMALWTLNQRLEEMRQQFSRFQSHLPQHEASETIYKSVHNVELFAPPFALMTLPDSY